MEIFPATMATGRPLNALPRPLLAPNTKNCSTCKDKGSLECTGYKVEHSRHPAHGSPRWKSVYCIFSDRGKQRQKTKRKGQLWQAKIFKQVFHIIQKESSRLVNPFWRLWLWKARVLHAFYLQDVKKKGVVFCMSSIVAASLLAAGPGSFTPSAWALTEENLLFLEAWRTIDRAYVDKKFNGQNWFRYREDALRNEPMRTREDTYAAIRKMLESLQDPFTRFLEPEKFRSLVSGTSGAITGVGLEVGFDMSSSSATSELVVVAPLLGGPAARAGILPGDVVLSIDGRSTQGMSLYEAAQWLQGPESTVVNLTVQCKDQGVTKGYALMREKITLNPVQWYLCDVPNGESLPFRLGYIRLSTFNQNAYRALKEAVETLRESGANAYILDIRNNGGGFFPAAIDIAKMWLDKGVIVYIADSLGVRDIYEADGTGVVASNEPLAVLVNKGTASASEILAGALKDNQRAVILGEPTFGKGKIQSVFGLSDGSGIAVTVARYETPGHIDIDKVGILPDFALPASFPVDGERFCKCIEGSLSGCTFPTKVFFPNNNRQSISVK